MTCKVEVSVAARDFARSLQRKERDVERALRRRDHLLQSVAAQAGAVGRCLMVSAEALAHLSFQRIDARGGKAHRTSVEIHRSDTERFEQRGERLGPEIPVLSERLVNEPFLRVEQSRHRLAWARYRGHRDPL